MGMRPFRTTMNPKSLFTMGVPKKFVESTLDDFQAHTDDLETVKEVVGEYLDNLNERLDNGEGICFF